MNLLLVPVQVQNRTENSIKYTNEIVDIQNMELNQFVSVRSFFLFGILEIDTEFLSYNADTWSEFESYQIGQKLIHDLIIVVNDGAERALELGANIITNQKVRSEERLQDFIVSTYSGEFTY